ncbi:hypothetical protein [Streptomyces venezuelae]|uniref:hypothetical protein n=1 Tax=Streptomyces venezuelae TaxID=54571 RepID=UPI001688392A|nr:hypothetical protein [Streptomyces venezuelae]
MLREQGVELTRVKEETVRILEAAGIVAAGAQPAKDALPPLGINVEKIQRRADTNIGPGAFQYPRPAYTPDTKKALEHTLSEARAPDR